VRDSIRPTETIHSGLAVLYGIPELHERVHITGLGEEPHEHKICFSLVRRVVVCLLHCTANAQADRGAIRGEAQDTQKGSIAGAQLSLKNTAPEWSQPQRQARR